MTPEMSIPAEETLDPDDWEAMRSLGHRMVDDMVAYIQGLRDSPAWRHAPEVVKAHFDDGPPLDPQPAQDVYTEFTEYVLPYLLGNSHPRFWGWVAGTGTVMGAFAEFLATAANIPSGCFAYVSPNYVERQVIQWLVDLFGFPSGASGLLTTGCSSSNLVGLAVARNARAGNDVRRSGLSTGHRMVLYASEEAHSSIQKAVELLGLGSDALRPVPINEAQQIDLPALRAAIDRDRQQGYAPFCVVGVAGTTNEGAIDDLEGLADLCQEEELWFHVDGAFGAWAAIAPASRHLVAGMERADSLAFDLHKWMYLPYPIGGLLVRREEDHRNAFSLHPTYLAHGEGDRGLTGIDLPWTSDYGIELSRGFSALKAWMTIKEQGIRKYGRLIQQNIDQAQYLAALVEATPELELALPPALNVVCFRYVQEGLNEAQLDLVNKQIEVELQERGIAVPSVVTIRGKQYLHAAITNHRSRKEDFDVLVAEVIRLGRELAL